MTFVTVCWVTKLIWAPAELPIFILSHSTLVAMALASYKWNVMMTIGARNTTLIHASLFVLGFSLIFVVGWGGAATVLGQLFGDYKQLIPRIGGVVVIVFGLVTMGALRIPWLYYDTRPQWQLNRSNRLLSSLLMGVVFAAGWTPCIGYLSGRAFGSAPLAEGI